MGKGVWQGSASCSVYSFDAEMMQVLSQAVW